MRSKYDETTVFYLAEKNSLRREGSWTQDIFGCLKPFLLYGHTQYLHAFKKVLYLWHALTAVGLEK